MRVWKTGERCLIEAQGRKVPGYVRLASENGKSLLVEFEALLLGHAGSAPLVWRDDLEGFYSIASGHEMRLGELPAEREP